MGSNVFESTDTNSARGDESGRMKRVCYLMMITRWMFPNWNCGMLSHFLRCLNIRWQNTGWRHRNWSIFIFISRSTTRAQQQKVLDEITSGGSAVFLRVHLLCLELPERPIEARTNNTRRYIMKFRCCSRYRPEIILNLILYDCHVLRPFLTCAINDMRWPMKSDASSLFF